jgi:hypothetical protein
VSERRAERGARWGLPRAAMLALAASVRRWHPYAATAGPAAFEASERRSLSEVSRGVRPSKVQSARAPCEAPMPEHGCARVVFSGYSCMVMRPLSRER